MGKVKTLLFAVAAFSMQIDDVLLKPELQALVKSDLTALSRLEIRAPSDSAFAKVFQGSRPEDVVRYLNERIHYIGVEAQDEKEKEEGSDNTYASNYGSSWLSYFYHHDVLHEADSVPFENKFRNISVRLDSPRTGFVAVGAAYTGPETSDIDRLDTLIHEARHSDCAQIPSVQDLANFDKDLHSQISDAGKACTHMHMPCPAGHELAGQLACDEHPWGAYSIGYVFSKSVYHFCQNCSEVQRQAALASATDDFGRLSKKVQQGLLKGTNPDPVMGSVQ
jgi:hypothetical protein